MIDPGLYVLLLIFSGSHGMLILHVCVNLITIPSRIFIKIGLAVGSTSLTGVPGNTKYPLAPSSATAISTAIFIGPVLKQVAALGKSSKLLSEIIFFHACVYKYVLALEGNQTAAHRETETLVRPRTTGALI